MTPRRQATRVWPGTYNRLSLQWPIQERADTKKAIVLEMLRRKEGATITEIAKATQWQNHTIRGFISRTSPRRWD